MKRRSRILLVLGLLLVGAAAAVFTFDLDDRFGLAARLGFAETGAEPLELYGNVDIRDVELGFRVSGRIVAMKVEEGDRVARGDRLAELDRLPYEDRLRLARAEASRERANLEMLESGSRPEEIAQADALVAEREAALDNARREFERQDRLVRTSAVSQETFYDAQARLEEARARLASARQALELAREGFRQEQIAAARAAFEAAEASAALAEIELDDTLLHAPADGTILARVREPGAIVSLGQTVYTMALAEPVWVRAYIGEPSLGLIRPGQEALIVTDTRPDEPYHGQIGFISPVAEFTPKSAETPELRSDLVYRLRVVVTDGDEGLRQGMPVTVRIPGSPPATG